MGLREESVLKYRGNTYRQRYNETELRVAIRFILTVIGALHAREFVHRDVRWPNVLQTL